MNDKSDGELDGLGIDFSWGEGYRTCSQRGSDCLPEPRGTDELGARRSCPCAPGTA